MKLIHKDIKSGKVKIKIENLDDLWYTSTFIDQGDIVEGSTYRKIKIGRDENAEVVKKKVYLKINVEKVEFHKYNNVLRVSGKIIDGPDDVSRGSYHTFNVDEGTILKIVKKRWLKYQLNKLDEATTETSLKILLCIFDREDAIFARLKKYGAEKLSTIKGNVTKKAFDVKSSNFYKELIKIIEDYNKREDYDYIICASPSFFKDYLINEIKNDEILKKIVTASCSGVTPSSINEILKRPELKKVLEKDRSTKELKYVEKLLENISKDKPATYGINQIKDASKASAIEELLITDKLIHEYKINETFNELEDIFRQVDSSKGQIHIINSEGDGGKKLDGLGGIGAILRFSLS